MFSETPLLYFLGCMLFLPCVHHLLTFICNTDISTANWIIQPPPVTLSAGHPHLSQHGGPSYGNSTRSRSLESLASLLDRLSLSKHLNLFQRNEIDLDALMLMSEKDYAEIGLPKVGCLLLLDVRPCAVLFNVCCFLIHYLMSGPSY